MKTVIVQWTGSYSYEQVCNSDKRNGIYLLIGKRKYERNVQIQYCGITENYFCNRINNKHHKLSLIKPESLSVWLGEIIYPEKFNRTLLELAEHCFVSFWSPELNDRKTVYFPQHSICFISQWFHREGQPRLTRPPIMKHLPDVLWWDEERWRTGNLKVEKID